MIEESNHSQIQYKFHADFLMGQGHNFICKLLVKLRVTLTLTSTCITIFTYLLFRRSISDAANYVKIFLNFLTYNYYDIDIFSINVQIVPKSSEVFYSHF